METDIVLDEPVEKTEKNRQEFPINPLLLTALLIDLLTPFLIWKGVLPAQARWLSHAAVALMLFGSLARMIVFNHVPRAFWLVIATATVWTLVAVLQGQGLTATIWGLWLMFQFPFVALFVYLQPKIPSRVGEFLLRAGLAVLAINVAIQLVQYFTGQKIGDNLAGLFGRNGTANAVMFVFLINCIFLGYWIVSKRWLGLVITLGLGVISGVFGEVKLYPFVVAVISVIAIVLFAVRSRSIGRLLIYTVVMAGVLIAFTLLYNNLVPSSKRRPIQAFVTDPQMLNTYLNQSYRVYKDGRYQVMLGRNDAFSTGWNSIQRDPVSMLFGYGIGARSESKSLGTSGIGLSLGGEDTTVGTSLLVMMQEMGLVGLALVAGFFIWVVVVLSLDIRRRPNSPAIALRYALLLFSLFWPVWLWYGTVWTMRVPMLLYWMMLGYVMAEAHQPLAGLVLHPDGRTRE